jgi:hypothetical protein
VGVPVTVITWPPESYTVTGTTTTGDAEDELLTVGVCTELEELAELGMELIGLEIRVVDSTDVLATPALLSRSE